MRIVELHYFSWVIEERAEYKERLRKQYIETLRDYDTLVSLGRKDYIEHPLTDDELLCYYKTLPTDDAFFAVYDKSEDDYVGTCRLMRPIDKSVEVGYMVFLNKRHTGYGKAILKEAIRYISEEINDIDYNTYDEMRATTFENNIASCKAFESNGFIKTKSKDGLATYVKKL